MRNSSKGFTPVLLILLLGVLVVVGYLGYKYFKSSPISTIETIVSTPSSTPSNKLKIGTVSSPTPQTVCGKFPSNVEVQGDHYTVTNGPMWAPDCKHIAWSSWQSTFSNPSIPVGLFIYNLSDNKSTQAYLPKEDEGIELKYWQDNNSIVFTKDGQGALYLYDLTTDKVTSK